MLLSSDLEYLLQHTWSIFFLDLVSDVFFRLMVWHPSNTPSPHLLLLFDLVKISLFSEFQGRGAATDVTPDSAPEPTREPTRPKKAGSGSGVKSLSHFQKRLWSDCLNNLILPIDVLIIFLCIRQSAQFFLSKYSSFSKKKLSNNLMEMIGLLVRLLIKYFIGLWF